MCRTPPSGPKLHGYLGHCSVVCLYVYLCIVFKGNHSTAPRLLGSTISGVGCLMDCKALEVRFMAAAKPHQRSGQNRPSIGHHVSLPCAWCAQVHYADFILALDGLFHRAWGTAAGREGCRGTGRCFGPLFLPPGLRLHSRVSGVMVPANTFPMPLVQHG